MELPNLYTPAQVADYLHVSRGTIYSMLSRGQMESMKVGRSRRFTEQQIRDYLDSNRANGRVEMVQLSHNKKLLPSQKKEIDLA